jgi:plasmid maintenance system killer protein
MSQLPKRKKFKSLEVEEYMLGKWFKQWSGIQPAEKARWRIKVVANAQDKKDFQVFSGFRLEQIEAVKDYHSIRIGGQWRCFFV